MKIEIELDNLMADEQEMAKKLAKLAKKEKKNSIWKPQIGDTYYFIDGSSANYSTWDDDFIDRDWFAIGNCFQTKEEAEEALIKIQMQTKWKQMSLEAGEADNPWDRKHNHYFVEWDTEDKKLDIDCNAIFFTQKTYFPTEESLEAAITELGEENIKKYILGVKNS